MHSALTPVQPAVQPTTAAPTLAAPAGPMSVAFPKDGVQPWEQLDAAGHVMPDTAGRTAASALGPSSQFATGSQRFLEGGGFSDLGSATKLASPAGGPVAYAMYRFSLGSAQPGVVTVDANLHGAGRYYVAVSNYALNHWEWYGPFADGQLTLPVTLAQATSALGNTFVTVAAFDGAELDVVGVGVTPRDPADTTAPPVPAKPVVTPVKGGLELTWVPVLAGDLAGYQLYYSSAAFSAPTDAGVQRWPALEGTARLVLPSAQHLTFVALSAVDVSGNASALSPLASAVPLAGPAPAVQLSTSAVAGRLNDVVTLTASGAASYDFDLDGDGVFEVTGNTSGTAQVDTTRSGLLRPHVRGTDSGGTAVALGGVSLIISINQPPIAYITTQGPVSGAIPYDTTLSGDKSTDPDGTIVEYAWDVHGDGIFDLIKATPGFNLTVAAAVSDNIRLRVTDDGGAWGLDTLLIEGHVGQLQLFYEPSLQLGESTDIYASYSGPETVATYDWDLDYDGTFETNTGTDDRWTYVCSVLGTGAVAVRATLDTGGLAYGQAVIVGHGWYLTPYLGGGAVEENLSAASCGGCPAISFIGVGGQLGFQRSTDWSGYYWANPVSPVPAATPVQAAMVRLSNGRVGIVYADVTHSALAYTYALDDAGSTWSAPVTLESFGINNAALSLALIGGNPAVAYYHSGLKNPLYDRATNALGSAWAGPVVIANTPADDGQRISLAEVEGNPAVAYGSSDNFIHYCRAQNPGGTSWDPPVGVAATTPEMSPLALAVVGGYPAIAFVISNGAVAQLYYSSANDTTGAGWPALSALVDTAIINGIFAPAMVVYNNYPYITYNKDGYQQMVARGNGSFGNGWQIEQVANAVLMDTNATSGMYVDGRSMGVANVDVSTGWASAAVRY